jgi:hypothetical protein
MTTIGDAMLTFERAPKSRTPKFSIQLADRAEFPRKNVVFFDSTGAMPSLICARHSCDQSCLRYKLLR